MTQGFPAQGFAPQQPQYAQPTQPQFQQQAPPPQQGGFFQTQDPHIQAQQGPAVPPPPQVGAQQQADTSGFWGGAASISFDDRKGYVKSTPRGGQILSKSISNQTKMGTGEILTWNDGTPRKQMVLLLQTAERADPQDNGQRQLFIKGDMPRATREAFQAVGAADVEIGGWLYMAWVDEKAAKQPGYNPQKLFKAIYAPPGAPDPLAGQHVPAPAPSASADQFAAHAQYQQNGTVPSPGPGSYNPAQAAQQAAAQYGGSYTPQGPAQPPALAPAQQSGYNPFQPGGQAPQTQQQPQHAAPAHPSPEQQPGVTQAPGQWTPFGPQSG